jgi:hypothetical protein
MRDWFNGRIRPFQGQGEGSTPSSRSKMSIQDICWKNMCEQKEKDDAVFMINLLKRVSEEENAPIAQLVEAFD